MSVSVLTSITNILSMLQRTDASLTGSSTNAAILADLGFCSKKELIRWFDEAIKALASKIVLFVRRDTATVLVAGTPSYAAPSRHLRTLYAAHLGKALRAKTTAQLEALDRNFATTAGTPTHFYEDKIGQNIIGLYKVPTSLDVASGALEIIQSEYPAEVDELEGNTAMPVPVVIADYFEVCVLREAYKKESDFCLPEVAANLEQFAKLMEAAIMSVWGSNQ